MGVNNSPIPVGIVLKKCIKRSGDAGKIRTEMVIMMQTSKLFLVDGTWYMFESSMRLGSGNS